MTSTLQITVRRAGLALASFGLLAAGELPQLPSEPGPAEIVADTSLIDQADDTTVSDLVLQRPASLTRIVADIAALPAPRFDAEANCLTRAVFFEARGEPLEGQLAVAQVILNRVASGRYAGSVCGVIAQRGQFTFTRRSVSTTSVDWRTAQAVALVAQAERWLQVAPRTLSFHAVSVRPAGWGGMERVGRIGNHVFYR